MHGDVLSFEELDVKKQKPKPQTNKTKVKTLTEEIENKILNVLMSKSVEFGLNKIADAFQKRAEKLYRSIDN